MSLAKSTIAFVHPLCAKSANFVVSVWLGLCPCRFTYISTYLSSLLWHRDSLDFSQLFNGLTIALNWPESKLRLSGSQGSLINIQVCVFIPFQFFHHPPRLQNETHLLQHCKLILHYPTPSVLSVLIQAHHPPSLLQFQPPSPMPSLRRSPLCCSISLSSTALSSWLLASVA